MSYDVGMLLLIAVDPFLAGLANPEILLYAILILFMTGRCV